MTSGHRDGMPLWLGYLPLLLGAAVVVAMVVVAPSDRPETAAPSIAPVVPSAPGTVTTVAETPATSDGSAASSSTVTGPPDAQTASGWGTTVTPCADRERQTDSGYAPPCFEFDGANGGATARGVTGDTITVTFRSLADSHLLETLATLAGKPTGETPDDLWRTADGLIDYFNENYQFYGRRIELTRFDGSGSLTAELTGGGQEAANNDALVAVEHEAFADVDSSLTSTQPYAEALTANGVVALGAPYMSRQWFQQRAPYAWSGFPDCTLVAETSGEVGVARLLAEPAALAGGDLNGRPRTLGVIHPNNQEYARCADRSVEIIEEGGFEVASRQNYTLDLANTDSNATSILAKLKDQEITSVASACDPLMMRALVAKAEQQQYYPEWFIVGVGFIDLDLVGQMIAAGSGDQWTRAIGGSPSAAPVPRSDSEAYEAYKSVRDDEPSLAVDVIYGLLARLAIGIQMAGPELTPSTFETGMFNYPEGDGRLGAWDFTPDNRSGLIDVRLVFWQNDRRSPFNGEPGTYIDTGERFRDVDDAPTQDELLEMAESLQ